MGNPTGIPPALQLHPSRICNLACAHCYSSSSPTMRGELPFELLAQCLEDASALGYCQLAVSGGEPLLYPALPALLSKARALGMVTALTSNGMLLSPARWEPVAPFVDVLAISIDGTPLEHDRMRRRAGAFAATVANLERVRASGVPFGIIFTLTQHNVDSLEFVLRLAGEQGARSVQVHPLTLHGRAKVALPGARPDGIELAAALLEAERLGAETGVAVHVDAVSGSQLRRYRDHLVPTRPIRNLTKVAPTLVVEADATVLPLTHEVNRSLRLGSLVDAPLSALAPRWLADGGGEALAGACERTWAELVKNVGDTAVYWFDEVAARTHEDPSKLTPLVHGTGVERG